MHGHAHEASAAKVAAARVHAPHRRALEVAKPHDGAAQDDVVQVGLAKVGANKVSPAKVANELLSAQITASERLIGPKRARVEHIGIVLTRDDGLHGCF